MIEIASNIAKADIVKYMDENLKQINSLVAPYERLAEIIIYPSEFEKTPKRSIKRYLYNI